MWFGFQPVAVGYCSGLDNRATSIVYSSVHNCLTLIKSVFSQVQENYHYFFVMQVRCVLLIYSARR